MSAAMLNSPVGVGTRATIRTVLFDLDGTLVDSAPDLAGATNEMLVARGLPEVPFERLRPMVGAGARGMMGVAFGVSPKEMTFPALRDEFFDRYERRLLRATRPFDGVAAMLQALSDDGLSWGIVTNKSERFALPLARGLGWSERAAAVVGGDTTPHSKPHPEPLLEAARRAGVAPGDVVTLPGVSGRCRVHVARSAVPGVVWLYVVDAATGVRRRGHVALPLHQDVARHGAAPDSRDPAPEDT